MPTTTTTKRRRRPVTKATQRPATSPHDFQLAGVRFHNARQQDGHWLVDVSNGDATYTLHNRYGSWLHDIDGEGRMAEPVRVARALGTGMSQLEVSQALGERVAREQGTAGRRPRKQVQEQQDQQDTTTNHQKEATMARKPRTTTAKAEETAKPASTKASNGKAPAFTLTKKDATAIAKELRTKSATMKEIRERYGHSDGSKVRAALREHGFGSKGQDNPEGLTPTEWRAKYGDDGEGEAPAKAKPRASRKPATKAEEPEPEEAEEEETEAEETADERRKRLRRERRAAKKAEEAKPARRRKPKAAAANPS